MAATSANNDDTQTTIPIAPLGEGQPVFPFDDTPTPALAPDSEVTLEFQVGVTPEVDRDGTPIDAFVNFFNSTSHEATGAFVPAP